MSEAILGLDIGTTSTKAVLFDLSGAELAAAERFYPLQTPQTGWVEQNPEDLKRQFDETLRKLAKSMKLSDASRSVVKKQLKSPQLKSFSEQLEDSSSEFFLGKKYEEVVKERKRLMKMISKTRRQAASAWCGNIPYPQLASDAAHLQGRDALVLEKTVNYTTYSSRPNF